MAEVLFYHLMAQPLERALPMLLEKSLERGWRCVVQAVSPERLAALDEQLWTYSDAAFLPHGTASEGDPAGQPVFLTLQADNPNNAAIRFLVEGADLPGDAATYQRLVVMFDGHDDGAVAKARVQWREVKAAGHEATYWQADDSGRWVKKA